MLIVARDLPTLDSREGGKSSAPHAGLFFSIHLPSARKAGGCLLIGWRRKRPRTGVLPLYGVVVMWINPIVGEVNERVIRRIFRTAIGDWAAELDVDGKLHAQIFDHHPTTTMMRALRAGGTEIAD